LDIVAEKFRIMWLSNMDFYFQMAMIDSGEREDGSRILYFSPMAAVHLDPLFGLYPSEPSGPPPPDALLALGDESFRWGEASPIGDEAGRAISACGEI
jgi:hypothetical protein